MRRLCWLVVVGLSLVGRQADASSTITLNDVRYSTEGGHSRVTLSFDGEVRYSPSLEGGVVRLGFSRTSVAVPMKARRQLLQNGLVTAISVTPLSNDSAVVAIMLQPGTTYRCVLPSSGNSLQVEVLPVNGRAAGREMLNSAGRLASAVKTVIRKTPAPPARASEPLTRPTAAPAQAKKDAGTETMRTPASTMVDIPAIAREQLHAEPAARTAYLASPPKESAGVSPVAAVALSSLIAVLVTGTGIAVVLRLRNKAAKPTAPPSPVKPVLAPPADEISSRPHMGLDLITDEPVEDDESEFIHDTSLQLARTFRRGSEEITLARRLHDRPTPQLSGPRMDETLSRATTQTQRLHFARKLGVGRGEMDLAVKLRTIRPAEKREGVES
jgi:hypothetical protein